MTWRIAPGYWTGIFPTIAQGSPKRSDVDLDVATWGTDPFHGFQGHGHGMGFADQSRAGDLVARLAL